MRFERRFGVSALHAGVSTRGAWISNANPYTTGVIPTGFARFWTHLGNGRTYALSRSTM